MESSLFLAKILGPYLVIVTAGILFNLKTYQRIIDGFQQNAALTYIGGMLALISGLLIVVFHNVWAMNWTLIITLIGWSALIKGIFLIMFPTLMLKAADYQRNMRVVMAISLIIFFGLGVILCVNGYAS
ncbi:MAG: hypothetical protein P9M13_03445 [Candidatus Ancaeobacter aquaticus]|nr:hypothetical protein [Candidatus Ancaeobacter aquaticus]